MSTRFTIGEKEGRWALYDDQLLYDTFDTRVEAFEEKERLETKALVEDVVTEALTDLRAKLMNDYGLSFGEAQEAVEEGV